MHSFYLFPARGAFKNPHINCDGATASHGDLSASFIVDKLMKPLSAHTATRASVALLKTHYGECQRAEVYPEVSPPQHDRRPDPCERPARADATKGC